MAGGSKKDREIWKRRPEGVGHTPEGLDLTWHCRHHSLCTLQALWFPQFQQQPDRAPQP